MNRNETVVMQQSDHKPTQVACEQKRWPKLDLVSHHARCELNYHQLKQLLPGMRDGREQWEFSVGIDRPSIQVDVKLMDLAPYTTTVSIEQEHAFIKTPKIVVRLYHDVGMAEIVSWDHHRHWRPQYQYPNANMYHPDEKLALNQFLGDWLNFCRKLGLLTGNSVI